MRLLTVATLALTVLVLAVPASQAQATQQAVRIQACATIVGTFVTNLSHGEVGWVSDGRSSANFVDCPIPAGTFGPGSDPLSDQDIDLDGVPLTGQTGAIDTLVEVDGINCLREGETKNMGTRMRGLHMSGTAFITFNGGGSGQLWDLDVYSANNQNSGTMSVTLEDSFGGIYSSSLPVVARLVFTSQGTGAQVVIEDPSCEIHFDSAPTPWVIAASGKFDPAAQGMPPLPGGVSVDGNGDGTPDYITSGRSNFIPGVEYTGTGSGLTALTGDSLVTATISPWKWWLFRELYLLFKHLVWPKPINPLIDVINEEPVGVAHEVPTNLN